jgi:hypothetical protein
MAFAFVNEAHDFNFGVNQPSLSLSVTKGNLLVAHLTSLSFNSGYEPIIFDGRNIWKQVTTPFQNSSPSGYGVVTAWWTRARQNETLTVEFFDIFTQGFVAGAALQATRNNLGYTTAQVTQWTGPAGNSLETFTTAVGTNTAPASAIPVAGLADLIIGIAVPTSGGTVVETAGWTNAVSPGTAYSQIYAIETAAGTFTPTFLQNSSAAWSCLALAFRAASATTTYTISGALGSLGANATVLFISTTTSDVFSSTANGSGNYTSPGLVNDTYLVQPQIVGATFNVQTQIISGANVTGLNFTGTAVPSVLTLTTTISDTMIRANENPLSDGGNWGNDGTPVPPNDYPCQLISNECIMQNATIVANYAGPWSGDGLSLWVGAAPANNQFAQFQIDALTATAIEKASAELWIRCGSGAATAYVCAFRNNGDGTLQITVYYFASSGGPSTPSGIYIQGAYGYGIWTATSQPFSLGDKFGFAAIGGAGATILYITRNSTVIGNYADTANNTNLVSGFPTITLFGNNVSDAQISQFTAGGVSASFPPASGKIQASDFGIGLGYGSNDPARATSRNTSMFGTNIGTKFIG